MKILYIAYSCSPVYGSEDTIGWNIPMQAAQRGNDVYVIVRSGLKSAIEKWLANNPNKNTPHFFFVETSTFLEKIAKGPLYTLRLFEFAKRAYKIAWDLNETVQLDVIHQITPVEFRSIGDYGAIPNVKYIIGPIAGGQKIASSLQKYSKHKFSEWLRIEINEIIIHSRKYKSKIEKADVVMFANNETKAFFLKHSLANENDIVIPEIGVPVKESFATTKKDSNKCIFLMVGRLIPIKGFDIVLDALKYIEQSNFCVRICGAGELMETLQNRINQENLEAKVELVGFVPYEKMKTEYEQASALIMPSLREATGTVLVEAMMNAVPVITFDQFGASLIVDEENGWLINCDQPTEDCVKAVAESMRMVICDKNQTANKGIVAANSITKFSWDRKYNLYSQAYRGRG